jgi:diguanylate cyclase (GGDEF)-like protein
MSLAFGIVAAVNLVLGYALALLLQNDAHESPRIDELDSAIDPYAIVKPSADRSPKHSEGVAASPTAMPANSSEQFAEVAQAIQGGDQLRQVSNELAQAITDESNTNPAKPINEVGAVTVSEKSGSVGSEPEAQTAVVAELPIESMAATIAKSETLLDAVEQLVQSEEEPAIAEPISSSSALVDASQLEVAITSWWENDPQRSKPICIGQIEIDNLRQLTAELGTAVAGNLANKIEQRVLSTLRPGDLVASLGRSRFLVLFLNADAELSAGLIESLRRRMGAAEFVQSGRSVSTTLTAGVAQATTYETVESFLARAADALAEARRGGRNRVSIHEGETISTIEPTSSLEQPEQITI